MSDLINNPALLPPGTAGGPAPIKPATGTGTAPTQAPATGPSFADLLAQKTVSGAPTFSKHALERLSSRRVELMSISRQTLGRLTDGIQRAGRQGRPQLSRIRNGTVFVAFPGQNNTVITAVTPEAMKSHVFTNIDSAVIA